MTSKDFNKDEVNNSDIDLEEVLSKFSLTGRFYMKFFLLITLTNITNEMYYFNFIFAAAEVNYRCQYPNCERSTQKFDEILKNKSEDVKCYRFEVFNNITCSIDNLNRSAIVKCHEWKYEDVDSFVSEFNLGCQDWKRTFIGTIHGIGNMFGLIILGPVSDKIGRKKTIILTGLTGGILGLIRSVTYSYWLYVALEMLEAAIGDTCTATFTYSIEMATKNNRVLFNSIFQAIYGATDILIAIIAWRVRYWRNYLRTLYSTSLIFLLYWFYMDESPRWLLSTGRKKEAVEMLKKAAEKENIVVEEETLNRLRCVNETSDINLIKLIKITIASKTLLFRFLGCVCVWITCTFTAFAFMFNSVSLQGNKYLNYAITGALYMPASLSLLFVLSKYKRKTPLVVSFILTGILCVAQSFVPLDYEWASKLFYFGGTFVSSLSLPIVYLYTAEIFPTYTRNSMHAMCSSVGRIGGILATQTPLLYQYWPGLPAVLIGGLVLAAGLICIVMPDTADDLLPDDVGQAEAVGSKINVNDKVEGIE